MSTLGLILREIVHRKVNFALGLGGVVTAVALFVFVFSAGQASRLETARLMRDMGLNLRIIPSETNMDRFWAQGFAEATMPEAYVHKLAGHTGLSYSHLLAILQQKIEWRGMQVILAGLLPETSAADQKKPSMSLTLQEGQVAVGYEVARRFGLADEAEVEIRGKTFKVVQCLAETGSADDIRIFGHLHDVQGLLGLDGRVNEIKALNCLCFDKDTDAAVDLRAELARALPETKMVLIRSIADAREKQRRMIEKYLGYSSPFVLAVCAAWIGVLAMTNVRDRRSEIGILRAIGYGSGRIAALFLGRSAMVGMVGAILGFIIGTVLALQWAPAIFQVTAKMMRPAYDLLGWSVIAATVLAMAASLIPTMLAVTQDPAETLREE